MNIDKLSKEAFNNQTEIEKDLINYNVWDIAFKCAFKIAEENLKQARKYNKTIQKYAKDISENKQLQEAILLEFRINNQLYFQLLKEFVDMQSLVSKKYPSLSSATTHFRNWISIKLKNRPKPPVSTTTPLSGKL